MKGTERFTEAQQAKIEGEYQASFPYSEPLDFSQDLSAPILEAHIKNTPRYQGDPHFWLRIRLCLIPALAAGAVGWWIVSRYVSDPLPLAVCVLMVAAAGWVAAMWLSGGME